MIYCRLNLQKEIALWSPPLAASCGIFCECRNWSPVKPRFSWLLLPPAVPPPPATHTHTHYRPWSPWRPCQYCRNVAHCLAIRAVNKSLVLSPFFISPQTNNTDGHTPCPSPQRQDPEKHMQGFLDGHVYMLKHMHVLSFSSFLHTIVTHYLQPWTVVDKNFF